MPLSSLAEGMVLVEGHQCLPGDLSLALMTFDQIHQKYFLFKLGNASKPTPMNIIYVMST